MSTAQPRGSIAPALGKRARLAFACASALSAAAIVVVYYLPGLRDNTDGFGLLLVLGPPAAAMAMPFVLLGLVLRVPAVWLVCGCLMLAITAWTGTDLLREGGEAMSLLYFGSNFVFNILVVLVGLAVDLPLRAVLSRRRNEGESRSEAEQAAAD